jgi:hypothetical protein
MPKAVSRRITIGKFSNSEVGSIFALAALRAVDEIKNAYKRIRDQTREKYCVIFLIKN